MSRKTKVGRNDPCPCGSGKKYKHCCLNKPVGTIKPSSAIGNLDEILHPKPRISKLAIMRILQDEIDNPKLDEHLREGLQDRWTFGKLKEMETSEIVERLKSIDSDFEIARFKEDAKCHTSAIRLAEYWYPVGDRRAEVEGDMDDADFVMYAAIVLWKRLMPERWNVEMIDDSIQEGYEYIQQNNYKDGLMRWADAWTMIRGIVPSYITSVDEADEYLPEPLTQSIHNWSQDFELELANGGSDDISFYYLRIRYCSEFCAIFPDSIDLILHNMSRAEAESYASLGYMHVADNLFAELVEKHPDNVWGYVGWGDIYLYHAHESEDPSDYKMAEERYRWGLSRCDTETDVIRDRLEGLEKERRGQGAIQDTSDDRITPNSV